AGPGSSSCGAVTHEESEQGDGLPEEHED
ncbi:MAG: hypothetical protein RLZZ623_2210, partial [Actinomycetota bacterium]